jgi:hypothetical protein
MKTKIFNGIEFETELRHFEVSYNEWKKQIPKGWRLMTLEDINKLNSKQQKELNLGKECEYIKQIIKSNEKIYPFSCLYSSRIFGGRLYVDGNLRGNNRGSDAFGVRFCREIKKDE